MSDQIIYELSQEEIQNRSFKKELADCLILTQNNSLYLQFRPRNPQSIGKISLFGGHIEQGEIPLEAAIREIHEETGGLPASEEMVFIGSITEKWTNHTEIVNIYFWHDKNGTITGCYEDSPIEFKKIEDALSSKDLMDYVRWALEKAKKINLI